jgi:DNA gyrase subunit B
MKPLLDNGYVYIAQPPLFKITIGKTSEYLYDERALDKLVSERGVKGLCLRDKANTKTCADSSFTELMVNMSTYYNSYNNPILNSIPAVMLRGLVRSNVQIEDFESQDKMNEIVEYLNKYLKDHAQNYNIQAAKNYSVSLKYNPERALYNVKLDLGGDLEPALVTPNIIKSSEYRRLKDSYPLIREFLIEEEQNLILETDSEQIEINSFADLQRIVGERGQKGVSIQRFKGLGEMMPQQLWETTMDPAKRTLLQVTVDDAMLADQLFDILMGDNVAPRREFIEANAVYATNIDT